MARNSGGSAGSGPGGGTTSGGGTKPGENKPGTATRPKTVSDDTYLTVAEVAARLRASRQHVYNLIHQRMLAAVDIGGPRRAKLRVPLSALAQLAQDRRVVAAVIR